MNRLWTTQWRHTMLSEFACMCVWGEGDVGVLVCVKLVIIQWEWMKVYLHSLCMPTLAIWVGGMQSRSWPWLQGCIWKPWVNQRGANKLHMVEQVDGSYWEVYLVWVKKRCLHGNLLGGTSRDGVTGRGRQCTHWHMAPLIESTEMNSFGHYVC